jgi:hypothetical protein
VGLVRLFGLLAAAVFSVSVAQASPLVLADSSLFVSNGPIVQAGFKCGLINGKLVCGKGQGDGQKNDDDDDHHGKHSKEKKTGSGLSECTIQEPSGGGGCKNGKRVCEKLKSGKKCCGCVSDPNSKPDPKPDPKPADTPNPAAERVCCTANHPSGDPQKFCGLLNDARKNAGAARFNGEPAANIFCTPE